PRGPHGAKEGIPPGRLGEGLEVGAGKLILTFHPDAGSEAAEPPSPGLIAQGEATEPPISDDPLRVAGHALCVWLLGQARTGGAQPLPPGNEFWLLTKTLLDGWTLGRSEPLQQFGLLEQRLRQAPTHRRLLMALAEFFNRHGYLDLCLLALRIAQRVYPNDSEINRALGRLYHHAAQTGSDPRDWERAIRYWKLVRQAEPDNGSGEDGVPHLLAGPAPPQRP